MNNSENSYDKMIDEYIDSEGLDNTPPNPLVPGHLRRSKLHEDVKAQTEPTELAVHLKKAIHALTTDADKCLDSTEIKELTQQFSDAIAYLDVIDYTKPMEENYRNILHFNDSTMASILKIAQYEYNENKIEESLSIFALLAVLEPDDPDYWHRLGIVAYQTERYELALKAFNNATTLNTDYLEPRIFAAKCYLNLRQISEAKRELDVINELYDDKSLTDPLWKEMIAYIENMIGKSSN